MLENGLRVNGNEIYEQQFFTMVVEEQRSMCQLHGVAVREGSDFGEALLKHLFTGACGLWQGEEQHVACGNFCCGLQVLRFLSSPMSFSSSL